MAKINPVASSPRLSVTREIAIGIGIGLTFATLFRRWHMGYKESVEKYYRELEQQEQSSTQ